MNDLVKRLSKTTFFEKLPEKEICRLVDQAVLNKLYAGEFLCHQGDLWRNAVLLLKGELRWAMVSVGGREQVLFRITPGRTFWAHTMFDDQPMPASLSASKASLVCLWSYDAIAPVLSRNPILLWEILRQATGTMRQAREVIYGLAFQPVAGRLARLLLEQAARQEGQAVQRELTLSEIAATVATSQEVVCRLLYQFQADKLIELSRADFKLTDRTALEQVADSH